MVSGIAMTSRRKVGIHLPTGPMLSTRMPAPNRATMTVISATTSQSPGAIRGSGGIGSSEKTIAASAPNMIIRGAPAGSRGETSRGSQRDRITINPTIARMI